MREYVFSEMLQFASYIAGLEAIKVEVSVRHIGVTTAGIPIKHAQGNKCIQEVARATFMDANAFAHGDPWRRQINPDSSVVGDCVVELVGLEPTTKVLWNMGVSDQPTSSDTRACAQTVRY